MSARLLLALLTALALVAPPADARPLQQIRDSGALMLCAHPNSLPFASKTGDKPGFQVELARALAAQLGAPLGQEWIVTPSQVFRSNCDIILDVIGDQAQQSQSGLQVSKPYYRGGLVLVVPHGSKIHTLADLDGSTKVGVQYGSTTAMDLVQHHVAISIFAFEDEMMEALANHQIAAAVVTRTIASYFATTHPDQPVDIVAPDKTAPSMTWNIAIGMRRPDKPFRDAIDDALTRLQADGTIARIYASYGVTISPPE